MKKEIRIIILNLMAMFLILTFLGGCVGPIWSAALIVDATSNFKAAKTVDAEKYAPYEYYKAEEYLHKARQKEAYGQFERAVDYAKVAKEMAIAAQKKSHDAKAQESGPSVINPSDTASPEGTSEKINQINTQ
ncbi:MAG: DUF4398 domain-containing protein [Deltaproteobacteria bacterium]|nr:DUF4398 domain-containing protein [Deltaproteobacteria bacterium]